MNRDEDDEQLDENRVVETTTRTDQWIWNDPDEANEAWRLGQAVLFAVTMAGAATAGLSAAIINYRNAPLPIDVRWELHGIAVAVVVGLITPLSMTACSRKPLMVAWLLIVALQILFAITAMLAFQLSDTLLSGPRFDPVLEDGAALVLTVSPLVVTTALFGLVVRFAIGRSVTPIGTNNRDSLSIGDLITLTAVVGLSIVWHRVLFVLSDASAEPEIVPFLLIAVLITMIVVSTIYGLLSIILRPIHSDNALNDHPQSDPFFDDHLIGSIAVASSEVRWMFRDRRSIMIWLVTTTVLMIGFAVFGSFWIVGSPAPSLPMRVLRSIPSAIAATVATQIIIFLIGLTLRAIGWRWVHAVPMVDSQRTIDQTAIAQTSIE